MESADLTKSCASQHFSWRKQIQGHTNGIIANGSIMRNTKKTLEKAHHGGVQEVLVLPGMKHPGFTTIKKLAQNEGLEQPNFLFQLDGLAAEDGFSKAVEGLVGHGYPSPHLLAVISSMVKKSTKMLIMSNHRERMRFVFSNDVQSAGTIGPKQPSLSCTYTTPSKRNKELGLTWLQVWSHGMLFQGIK